MPPRSKSKFPWSEKVLSALLIPCRAQFAADRRESFPRTRAAEFPALIEWVSGEAKKKNDAEENNQQDPAQFSTEACLLFDHIVYTLHSRAVEGGNVNIAALNTLSFSQRAQFVQAKKLEDIGPQCYKWAKTLVRFHPASKALDIRPFQMFEVFGNAKGSPVNIAEGVYRHMPSHGMKKLFQMRLCRDIETKKKGEPFDFLIFLYVYAITRQEVTGFGEPRPNVEDKKVVETTYKPSKKFGTTGNVLEIIFIAWQVFAQTLGFETLSEMVHPHMCIDEDSGIMFLVPERSKVLPSEYAKKLHVSKMAKSAARDAALGSALVERTSREVCNVHRSMAEQAVGHVRMLTADFFNDVNVYVTKREVFTQYNGECTKDLEQFVAPFGHPPKRFDYPNELLETVRGAVNLSRAEREDSNIAEPAMQMADLEEQPEQISAVETDDAHVCSSDQSCGCAVMRHKLLNEMEDICAIVQCSFESFKAELSRRELQVGRGRVQLILTEPPEKLLLEGEMECEENSALTESDCKALTKLVYYYLQPGGHMVLFCPALLFSRWHQHFSNFIPPSGDEDSAFFVDPCPLIFLPKDRRSQASPPPGGTAGSRTQHCDVVVYALHVVRCYSAKCRPTEMVQWKRHGYVQSTFPVFSNVMDNIPCVSESERVRNDGSQGGSGNIMCSSQKSLALVKELVCRYSKPGDIVLDPFSGTFTTAEACLSVQSPRQFFGGDIESSCVQAGERRCLRSFLSRVLSSSEDEEDLFVLEEDLKVMAKTYFDRKLRGRSNALSSPVLATESLSLPHPDLPFVQILPQAMCLHFANVLKKPEYADTVFVRKSPDKWPEKAYRDIGLATPDTLQAAECTRFSLIRTSRQGLAVTSKKYKNDCLGYYFGTIVYVNMSRIAGIALYGGGIHSIDKKTFKSHSVRVLESESDTVLFSGTEIREIYIVPASYCPFYSATFCDVGTEANAILFVKQCNNIEGILEPSLVTVRATRTLEQGETIVLSSTVTYGKKKRW